VWNPAGLGHVESVEVAGQHVAYLDTQHYEYLGVAIPVPQSGIGASVQYLGSGNVPGTDEFGNSTGDFSSYFASTNLSYGRLFTSKLALGLTAKWIHEKIDDTAASAYAVDLGGSYALRANLKLAAALTNLGSQLTFISDGDPLPLAFHLGAMYEPNSHMLISSELVARRTGLTSVHIGGEWRPVDVLALRLGYRTDTLKGLSPLAGFSTGLGLALWGQELGYAWVPYGDLGSTHYFSFIARFGKRAESRRNLIQYQGVKKASPAGSPREPDIDQMIELLNEKQDRTAQTPGADTKKP
jgi:hypothetical protein